MHPHLKQASEYLRHYLDQGVPEMHLREHFLKHGWSNEWFDHALQTARTSNPPLQAATTAAGPQPPTKKYRVTKALKELHQAVTHHPQQYFSAVAAGALAYAIGLTVVILLIRLLFTNTGEGISSEVAVPLAILLIIAWYALTTTFFMVTTSQVLKPHHTHPASLRNRLRQAWKLTPRAAAAVMLASLITFFPILVTGVYALGMVFADLLGGSMVGGGQQAIFILLGLLSFIWLFIASLRLGLVQQVAVFEPHLNLRQILHKSSYLLRQGKFLQSGQWFLVKGAVLLLLINFLMNIISRSSLTQIGYSGSIVLNVILILVIIISQGVLAMLYFNRSAIYGHTK